MKKFSWKVLFVFCLSALAGSAVFLRRCAVSFVVGNEVAELSAVGLAYLDTYDFGERLEQANLFGPIALQNSGVVRQDEGNLICARSVVDKSDGMSDGRVGFVRNATYESVSPALSGSAVLGESNSVEISGVIEPRHSINEILDSLDEGTVDSLKVIARHDLIGYPDYRTVLLPLIKERALRNLVEKLDPDDWQRWERLTFGGVSKVKDVSRLNSVAKIYLANVYLSNPDVGVFLDESSFVFHRLFVSVQKGVSFDLEEELTAGDFFDGEKQNGASNENVLQNVSATHIPKLKTFARLSKDPVFRKAFDRINSILVEDYFTMALTGTPLSRILLVASVRPEYASQNMLRSLAGDLREISFAPSSDDRLELFLYENKRGVISRYAAVSPMVRIVAANMYAIGTVDALSSGNRPLAEVLYGASLKIQSGLAAQNRLALILYGKDTEVGLNEPL